MRNFGWILIFVGFGLTYPRRHWIIGPALMGLGFLFVA